MKLDTLKSTVSGKFARQAFKVKQVSPTIMVVAGMGGLVAGTVMFMKAKPKFETVIDDIAASTADMDEAIELHPEIYSETDRKKDAVKVYSKSAFAVVRIYAPAVIVTGLSVAAIMGSHRIMHKRNIALVGAYKTLEASYDRYRKNVREELGDEQDERFTKIIKREEVVTTTKSGKEKVEVKETESIEIDEEYSYGRHFTVGNPNWDGTDPMANLLFVRQAEHFLRAKLYKNGFLFLNDVYKSLGFKQTPSGQVMGWTVGYDDLSDFDLGYSFASGEDLPIPLNEGNSKGIYLDIQPEGMIIEKI